MEHASASFAWNAASFPDRSAYCTGRSPAELEAAYEEVRAGRGFVVVRDLPLDSLDGFIAAVCEVGKHFGQQLSQNAQGELVGHVIDATSEDPTPRMYRSNLELRPHSDITAMIALACWEKAKQGGESVVVSGVTVHDDPEAILPVAEDLIRFLDQGAGVLVLTDIYGATPSNIASRILKPGKVEGIAGVNLPMLIRALTYREEPLGELLEKALTGATEGVLRMGGTR